MSKSFFDLKCEQEALIDENGEIIDIEAFMALDVERDEKIERTAMWVKELTAMEKAIKEEEDALKERRQAIGNKKERLCDLLTGVLNGQKFSTAKVSIGFRKSSAVEVADGFVQAALADDRYLDYLKFKTPKPDKTAIKNAILNGVEIPGAAIVERVNMTIK